MPSESSFLSRFTLKFFEVLTAGLATAASGFLIAHFTGYFAVPASAPAIMQPAVIQKLQSGTQGAILADPAAPAPATPPSASVMNSAPTPVNAAPAAALRESIPANELPSSGGTEAKSHDAAETKSHDATKRASAQSFEARIRAALAKVGASYPASGDTPRRAAISPTDFCTSLTRCRAKALRYANRLNRQCAAADRQCATLCSRRAAVRRRCYAIAASFDDTRYWGTKLRGPTRAAGSGRD